MVIQCSSDGKKELCLAVIVKLAMLSIAIIITSILAIQTMQSAISPATLRVMATLQAHRARAIANTLRARAHYNAARARTNLGLLDHRVIRNSDDQFDDTDLDYDEEDFPSIEGDYDDVNIPDLDEGELAKFLPLVSNPPGDRKGMENLVGANEQFANNPGPEIPCAYGDFTGNLDPNVDTPRVPLNMVYDEQSKQWRETAHLGCQRPFEQLDNPIEGTRLKSDPTLGLQPSFAQTFAQPQFGQQLIFPWQVIQGIPAMQIVPQMNPYQNFPMQPMQSMSPLQPGSQMVFLRQSSSQDDKNDPHDHQKSNSEHPTPSNKDQDPHLGAFSHTHSYTHTHTHFKEPKQKIQIPNTQIVTPGLNLHVIQNQNTEIAPKQIPTHYGSTPPFGNTFQTTGGSVYNPNLPFNAYGIIRPSTAPTNGQPNAGGATFAQSQATSNSYGTVGPGTSTSQSQVMQTNTPSNIQYLVPPNIAPSSFTQSQMIQPYLQNPLLMELAQSPYSKLNMDDNQVGTVITDSRMRAPESPEYFDPNRPQNLQPVVNYIERQEGNMRRLVHSIENKDNLAHHFGVLSNINGEQYVRSPNQYEDQTIQDATLGTIPLENIHLNPPPTLPQNFHELNPEERQRSLDNYYMQEQENLRNFLEQVDENNKRNLNWLTDLVETGPGDSEESQDKVDNPNEITRSSLELVSSALTEDDPGFQQIRSGMSRDANTNLGHIIDVPDRREAEWYQRLARSLNKTHNDTSNMLMTEKDIINELKKDAKHDQDLLMIGYVGDSIIKELEKKKNETKRAKREIVGVSHSLPLNRFMLDPAARLDIPSTLDNLGAAVKNTFEHETAPLYHVRNMMGSAQDAVLATMKIPTKNFLIPSQYDIVRKPHDARLGDINPEVFSEKYSPEGHFDNTFQQVGSAIRGGVMSSQEALSHVGQVANHAKNAIHSTRYAAPRLLLKPMPTVTSDPLKNAVLIAPRMLGIANANDQVGILLDNSQGQFVKIGHLLDAIGVSNPNLNDVHLQKIMLEPKRPLFPIYGAAKPHMLPNLLGNVRVEDYNGQDDILLGSTVDALEKVKESFGVDNLKDLFDSVKNKLQVVLGNNVQKEIMKPNEKTKPVPNNERDYAHISKQGDNQIKDGIQNQEVVAASMIPESLVHPFMGHFSQNEMDQLWKQANSLDKRPQDQHLGQILGAINPVMFEKLFNESLNTEGNPEMSQSVFRDYEDTHRKEDEDVGTSMAFSAAMRKPFMGQASNKLTDDFLHKYNSNSEEAEISDYKKATERPEWMEVDFDEGNRLEE